MSAAEKVLVGFVGVTMLGYTSGVRDSALGHVVATDVPSVKSETFGVVSWQSGLPLAIVDGEPSIPEMTGSLKFQLAIKRMLDIVFSLGALIVLSPLLLVVVLAIRFSSPGGVLFRQTREGLDGKPFQVFKFRSMYTDRCDITGVAQTTRDDPRVTRIGRVIRRTSIDELPQLLNVLKGDMSLVGPRPHVFGMLAGDTPYNKLVPYYGARHRMVKPGLSGWAQANGLRGPTDDPQRARMRIDHDLAYIQNFSLWLDFRIVAMTLTREFLNGSAN